MIEVYIQKKIFARFRRISIEKISTEEKRNDR